jgi:hypothetical protein
VACLRIWRRSRDTGGEVVRDLRHRLAHVLHEGDYAPALGDDLANLLDALREHERAAIELANSCAGMV